MSDAEWALLNPSGPSTSPDNPYSFRYSALLSGGLTSVSSRGSKSGGGQPGGSRPASVLHASSLLPTITPARATSLLATSTPLVPRHAVAESAAVTGAVSERAVGGPPLPPLGTFPSAAAAAAAIARDMNALADGTRTVRCASLSRLCLCLTGVDWPPRAGLLLGRPRRLAAAAARQRLLPRPRPSLPSRACSLPPPTAPRVPPPLLR